MENLTIDSAFKMHKEGLPRDIATSWAFHHQTRNPLDEHRRYQKDQKERDEAKIIALVLLVSGAIWLAVGLLFVHRYIVLGVLPVFLVPWFLMRRIAKRQMDVEMMDIVTTYFSQLLEFVEIFGYKKNQIHFLNGRMALKSHVRDVLKQIARTPLPTDQLDVGKPQVGIELACQSAIHFGFITLNEKEGYKGMKAAAK